MWLGLRHRSANLPSTPSRSRECDHVSLRSRRDYLGEAAYRVPRTRDYLFDSGATVSGYASRNAFELGVFRGLISRADVTAAWANLQNDLRKGRLARVSIRWPSALRQAAQLSEHHAATTGARSLDILHVAAAKSIRATQFISFDGRQRTPATAAGLKVAP